MDDICGVAAATAVVGDPWTPLLLRDITRGHRRFERLLACGISRKVLTARLAALLEAGVLERVRYSEAPARFEYHLTDAGLALLPVLASLQEWGDSWRLPPEASGQRQAALVGTVVPPLDPDPLTGGGPTLLVLGPGPALLAAVVRSYDDRAAEAAACGARVVGVATADQDELDALARAHGVRSRLLSDADLRLATALRLPLEREGAALRLVAAAVVVDAERTVRATGSFSDGIALLRRSAVGA